MTRTSPPVVTETTVKTKESCEESDERALRAPVMTPFPGEKPPTMMFSYELSTFRFEQDRLTNVTDCNPIDCDAERLCGFAGYAADAEFETEDWLKVTKGIENPDCTVLDWNLLDGPYCPNNGCSGRCHIELTRKL